MTGADAEPVSSATDTACAIRDRALVGGPDMSVDCLFRAKFSREVAIEISIWLDSVVAVAYDDAAAKRAAAYCLHTKALSPKITATKQVNKSFAFAHRQADGNGTPWHTIVYCRPRDALLERRPGEALLASAAAAPRSVASDPPNGYELAVVPAPRWP